MIHVGPDILPVQIIPMIVVTIITLVRSRHLEDLLECFKVLKWIIVKDPPPGIHHIHKLIRIAFFIPIGEVIRGIPTSEVPFLNHGSFQLLGVVLFALK